jgi:hypothetical protein
MVAANARAPRASIDTGCAERFSGTTRPTVASASRPMGMLIRKIGRHPEPAMFAVTRRPPTSWPITMALPAAAAYRL